MLVASFIQAAKQLQYNLQQKFQQYLFDKLQHQEDNERHLAVQLADRCLCRMLQRVLHCQ